MMRNQSWQDDPTMAKQNQILPRHKKYLEDRGIPMDWALKAGLASVTKHQIAMYLLRKHFPFGGLAIPYLPIPDKPDYVRFRLDEELQRQDSKPQRYTVTPGEVRPYICPAVESEKWQSANHIIVVEGPPKAISVMANLDILCVGLGGVETGHDPDALKQGIERLHPELRALVPNWGAVTVTILFDSNRHKLGVMRGEKRIARCFAAEGAVVFIAELPRDEVKDENGKTEKKDWGPDDYIVKHGAAALRDIIESARSASEVHQPFKEIAARMKRSKSKDPKPIPENVAMILHLDPRWEGIIGYDEFAERVVMRRTPPWDAETMPAVRQEAGTEWSDLDDQRLACWLSEHWGLHMNDEAVGKVVQMHARQHPFHDVRDYLMGLTWDGTPRLDSFLHQYFGSAPTRYHQVVGVKFLLSMVARVMQPGCKADCVPIFEGEQGAGKSTAMQILSKGWFSDRLSDLGNKDSMIELMGVWLFELGEFDYLMKYESSVLKGFFSREKERYRSPYGRKVENHPRQCIFVGTVNIENYLKDDSGGRRYWPVRCGSIKIEDLRRDVDEIWAEAMVRYKSGEKWFLEGSDAALAKKEQADRYILDAWEDLVDGYLSEKKWVTMSDILSDCLQLEPGNWKRSDEMRVASALRRLTWHRERAPLSMSKQFKGKRPWLYVAPGVEFERDPEEPPQPTGKEETPVPTQESVPTSNEVLREEERSTIPFQYEVGATHSAEEEPFFEKTEEEEIDREEPQETPMTVAKAIDVATKTRPQAANAFAPYLQTSMINRVAGLIEHGMAPIAAWKKTLAKFSAEEESESDF